MRTPITLQEFLFTLNQDENILVTIIDYSSDKKLINKCWKSDLTEYSYHSDDRYTYFDVEYWFVQDFTLILGGLEITIVKSEEELD